MRDDIKLIQDYFEILKLQPASHPYEDQIDSILGSLEEIMVKEKNRGSVNLSITLPSKDRAKCTLCKKNVIYQDER